MTRRRRTLVIAAVAVLTVIAGIGMWTVMTVQVYRQTSASMEPSVLVGDRLICSRRVPDIVERGSVVVYVPGDSDRPAVVLTKRVVGLPGETVASANGPDVTVDGSPLDEPYALRTGETRAFAPVTVPENTYFVLGDNRARSSDSRTDGPVPHSWIKSVCRRLVRGTSLQRIDGT